MNNWENRGYFCLILANFPTNNWVIGLWMLLALVNFGMWFTKERRDSKAMKRRIEMLKSMTNEDFNKMTK